MLKTLIYDVGDFVRWFYRWRWMPTMITMGLALVVTAYAAGGGNSGGGGGSWGEEAWIWRFFKWLEEL